MDKRFNVAPRHCTMTSPWIQKDLAKACAEEVTQVIMGEIGDKNFSVLIDESRDVSIKEQMAVIVRFVNNQGKVMERFLKLVHVKECTSAALKGALLGVLAGHDLSLSRLRGQGYDGASNMRGEFNGLQRQIRDENPYAFYVHCFAHQLQLAVVTVSSSVKAIADFTVSSLIVDVKENLQYMRDNGWEPLLERAKSFCEANGITVPNMDESTPIMGRMSRRGHTVTQDHFYRVGIFYAAIDATKSEINHRFNEVSTELLICMSYLDPRNSFSKFDVDKLLRLAEIYSDDFTIGDRILLRTQLQNYILNVRRSVEFRGCRDLARLAEKMVEMGKDKTFPLVYRLIELTLILPVATASVERIFSAMKIIKTDLRNKVSDEWLNDLMVCYTEREIFKSIDDKTIMYRFQHMKSRRMDLPPAPSHS